MDNWDAFTVSVAGREAYIREFMLLRGENADMSAFIDALLPKEELKVLKYDLTRGHLHHGASHLAYQSLIFSRWSVMGQRLGTQEMHSLATVTRVTPQYRALQGLPRHKTQAAILGAFYYAALLGKQGALSVQFV